jgi:hypothetical protein
VTTWVLGRPDPVVTYSAGYWPGIGLLRSGIYLAEGLTICVKENPEYAK